LTPYREELALSLLHGTVYDVSIDMRAASSSGVQ
jgi:hypothetical protein